MTTPGQFPGQYPGSFQSPQPKPKRRKTVLIVIGSILAGIVTVIIIIGAIAAAVGNNPKSSRNVGTANNTAPVTTPAYTPPATPNPDGTYRGSCDYILPDNFPGTYHAIGEIDTHNTGNIGTVIKAVITWPQEGSAPIRMARTVRTAVGSHKVIRFRKAITSSQIDLLQSWQEHHGLRDGCTYKVSMIDTFGSVQP
jgi:hypothetical protein